MVNGVLFLCCLINLTLQYTVPYHGGSWGSSRIMKKGGIDKVVPLLRALDDMIIHYRSRVLKRPKRDEVEAEVDSCTECRNWKTLRQFYNRFRILRDTANIQDI